jgi:hypothetical protein
MHEVDSAHAAPREVNRRKPVVPEPIKIIQVNSVSKLGAVGLWT